MEVGREGCAPEWRMEADPGRARASCRHRVASKDHVHVHVHLPLHGPRLCGVLSVFDSWPRDQIIGRVPKRSSLPDARSVSCANTCAR